MHDEEIEDEERNKRQQANLENEEMEIDYSEHAFVSDYDHYQELAVDNMLESEPSP